jgi:hypothetical protein
MRPRTDEIKPHASNMDLPRWLDLDPLPDLVQAPKAASSIAPGMLVKSVRGDLLEFIAPATAPHLY